MMITLSVWLDNKAAQANMVSLGPAPWTGPMLLDFSWAAQKVRQEPANCFCLGTCLLWGQLWNQGSDQDVLNSFKSTSRASIASHTGRKGRGSLKILWFFFFFALDLAICRASSAKERASTDPWNWYSNCSWKTASSTTSIAADRCNNISEDAGHPLGATGAIWRQNERGRRRMKYLQTPALQLT